MSQRWCTSLRGTSGKSRTIHEKAAHLARLIATEHPYVDGNKRTALAAVTMLYNINGYEFDPDDRGIRHLLRDFATEGSEFEIEMVARYFEGWAKHYTHE